MSTLSSGLGSLSLASNGSATGQGNRSANRGTNRFSALASLAAEQDTEIEDELARGQPFPPARFPAIIVGSGRLLRRSNATLYAARLAFSQPLTTCQTTTHASPTAQKRLRDLKARISAQSKKNFVLERDVRYLDSRIALLIQNVSLSSSQRSQSNP